MKSDSRIHGRQTDILTVSIHIQATEPMTRCVIDRISMKSVSKLTNNNHKTISNDLYFTDRSKMENVALLHERCQHQKCQLPTYSILLANNITNQNI